MNKQKVQKLMNKRGFTLVEILVVIAIVSLLAVGIVTIGRKAHVAAQTKNTQATINVLVSALDEYRNQRNSIILSGGNVFPILPADTSVPTVVAALGLNGLYVDTTNPQIQIVESDQFTTSIEVLYAVLNYNSACKDILSHITPKDVTNTDNDKVRLLDTNEEFQFLEVRDAWGQSLWYINNEDGNFPIIVSAGVDELYGSADDIRSNEF